MELSSGVWNKVAGPVGWECGGERYRVARASPTRCCALQRRASLEDHQQCRNWPPRAPAHDPAGRASGPRLRLDVLPVMNDRDSHRAAHVAPRRVLSSQAAPGTSATPVLGTPPLPAACTFRVPAGARGCPAYGMRDPVRVLLTAASDDDEGVTFGDDVKSRRCTFGRAGGRHRIAAVVMLSRSCGHGRAAGVCWSAAAHRREKLPSGDHRDDLPWRRDRAESADGGRRTRPAIVRFTELLRGFSDAFRSSAVTRAAPRGTWAELAPW
jgi:hypothetical protein